MLPPTRSALLPRLLRTNCVAMKVNTYYTSHHALTPLEGNGWRIEIICLALPAPLDVIELIKSGCRMAACTHSSSDLPRTPICKCYSRECTNTFKPPSHHASMRQNLQIDEGGRVNEEEEKDDQVDKRE